MVSKDDLLPYFDREHAFVKHELFAYYLERFIMIVGRRATHIAYVDGFAGPWKSSTEDYSDTSFGRAIEVMKSCRKTLSEKHSAYPEFRALFFEKELAPFRELEAYANKESTNGIKIEARNEKFESSVDSIVEWIKSGEFTFLFVDPKGYDGQIYPNVLSKLLQISRCELLINFMWQFVNLATGHANTESHHSNLLQLYGPGYEEDLRLPPKEKEKSLIRRYMRGLREATSSNGALRLRVVAFPVEYSDKKGVKYYLVYATHNEQGIITFAEEMDRAAQKQGRVKNIIRQHRREERTQTVDLFSNVSVEIEVEHTDLISPWLDLLSKKGDECLINKSKWADMLEFNNCYPSQLQMGLKQLIDQGILEVVGLKTKRRSRFIHHENKEVVRRIK